MNRKHFLSSVFGAGTFLSFPRFVRDEQKIANDAAIIPPYLKTGDTIGISCPAGNITLLEIQPAITQIESWGYKVRIGDTVGRKDFTFGGTDAERAKDFQQMLDDPSIIAILCARGGYGSIRILDQLDFSSFAKKPKWIIGFSDITFIHAHLNRNFNIASIHSKMCNSFPEDWSRAEPVQIDSILSIRKALSGEQMKYNIVPDIANKAGDATGMLIGGNLKTIETLSGTKSDLQTNGKILFVEDTGEYLYSIDRMFWNLKRTGKLDKLAALIVGGFKIKPDDPGEEFGRTLTDIVLEKVKDYSYPVCFGFPVGHQKENYALKYGVNHRIQINSVTVNLHEV
ncbi:MAG: LD-carboxypeptidase [Bacteroidetes bacterium]|nr:LD-carboxypeptidase [Bacteroidota bacterium]